MAPGVAVQDPPSLREQEQVVALPPETKLVATVIGPLPLAFAAQTDAVTGDEVWGKRS